MALFHYSKDLLEVGLDEAGRGCLAGPVVAAAVILPKDFKNEKLNDSKKINEKQRDYLKDVIKGEALAWAIGVVDAVTIDQINILNSSFLAMHRALDQLKVMPELLLVDGNRFKAYKDLRHECIIKGDGKILSIAAASILAKTYRDELMDKLDIEYPLYNWRQNKGYPTTTHRQAIGQFGLSPYHRRSFNCQNPQLEMF